MKKSILYPVIFMIIITSIFSFVLALLNDVTAERIDFNNETNIRKTLLYVFNIDVSEDDPQAILATFNTYIEEKEIDDEFIYIARQNNEVMGYAFSIEGNGLWGSVKGFAAVSKEFDKLLGVDFVSHSETPGLGGRISELWYKEQFREIDLSSPVDNQYIIYTPSPGGNVDAIAGATLTSVSVKNLLNEDIFDFISSNKGGELGVK